MKTILKVLVGSQAHGLADEDSDFDYRGVFIVPTTEILKLGGKTKNTHWVEGKTDDTAWELGHFLQMATKCNPTILETFHAPEEPLETTDRDVILMGQRLRALFPKVWNTTDVINSHIGCALNQRKKFLEDKDGRKSKYASAYLRTLYQCHTLLSEGRYPVSMADSPIYETLKRYRAGSYGYGEVIDTCIHWQSKIEARNWINKETDLDAVNDFLLTVRRNFWSA